MIDSSFITTYRYLGNQKRFIMLAINRWNETYERVLLGGLTCDSDDYYNSEQNMNAIYLLNTTRKNHCILVFNTLSGNNRRIWRLHHCLIPQPKHILIEQMKTEYY
jgi:arginine decarboxylase